MAKLTKAQKKTQEDAITTLCGLLRVGSEVNCLVTHVARSGMSRRIRFWTTDMRDITSLIGEALDYRVKDGALVVGGCGMDMGFAVVHSLSYVLHGRVSDDEDVKSGYTLTHRWL